MEVRLCETNKQNEKYRKKTGIYKRVVHYDRECILGYVCCVVLVIIVNTQITHQARVRFDLKNIVHTQPGYTHNIQHRVHKSTTECGKMDCYNKSVYVKYIKVIRLITTYNTSLLI